MIQFFSKVVALDALLTGASDSFRNLASTSRAGCTKQVLRVCRRAFRNGDCEGLPSRPRKSSRTCRRRLKGTARPAWRSWARSDSTPQGVNPGEAPPVGSVSIFRSAAGQPAGRKHGFIGDVAPFTGRVTVRSCNQTVEVGTCGVGVPHGIHVPEVAIFCSTLKTLVPLRPQLGAALSARAGLGLMGSLLALGIRSSVSGTFGHPHGRMDR
jgi:hypothetical protein